MIGVGTLVISVLRVSRNSSSLLAGLRSITSVIVQHVSVDIGRQLFNLDSGQQIKMIYKIISVLSLAQARDGSMSGQKHDHGGIRIVFSFRTLLGSFRIRGARRTTTRTRTRDG